MVAESIPQPDWNHWILRLIALVIDSVIMGIIVWILMSFVLVSLLFSGAFWLGWGYPLVFPLVLGILEVLYFVVMELAFGGATFGKKILGLQVQMTDGARITFDKSLIRNISKIYWLLLLLDWLIGIVTPGADRKQKYTDRIAGTTVVQVKQAFVSAIPSTTSQ
jgi:uncharacterized RDD family membrane protein YckC